MFREVVLLVVIGGCYSPTAAQRCEVTCSDSRDCPDGLICDPEHSCNDPGSDLCSADPPPDPNACLTDKFSTFDASRWDFAAAGPVTIGPSDYGKLVLKIDPMVAGDGKVTSTRTFDLTNSEVDIEVVQLPQNNYGTTELTFGVIDPAAAGYILETSQTNLIGSAIGGSTTVRAYRPLEDRHIRIRSDGASLLIDTSPDRSTGSWVPFDSVPVGAIDITKLLVQFGLHRAQASALSVPMFVELDNFAYITPTCDPVPFPAPGLRDSFDTGTAGPLAAHIPESGGAWFDAAVAAGMLAIVHEVSGGHVVHPNIGAAFYLATIPTVAADYDVEADVTLHSSADIARAGLVARGSTGEIGYVGEWATNAGTALFEIDKSSGTSQPLTACDMSFVVQPEQPHRLRLRVRGDEITEWFDGQLVCTANDTSLVDPGSVGLSINGMQDFLVDNMLVTPK